MFNQSGTFLGFYFYLIEAIYKWFGYTESSIDYNFVWLVSFTLTGLTILFGIYVVYEITEYIYSEYHKMIRRRKRKKEKGY